MTARRKPGAKAAEAADLATRAVAGDQPALDDLVRLVGLANADYHLGVALAAAQPVEDGPGRAEPAGPGYTGLLVLRFPVTRSVGLAAEDLANVCARLTVDDGVRLALARAADKALGEPRPGKGSRLDVGRVRPSWDSDGPDLRPVPTDDGPTWDHLYHPERD